MKEKSKVETALDKVNSKIESFKNYPIPNVTYFDLNPIYRDFSVRWDLTNQIIRHVIDQPGLLKTFDYIACVESRGFIIGSILAHLWNKGLILLRSKPGRLPGKTTIVEHTLEYGDAQMEVQNGTGNVLIFDDVLATGGTANAAIKLLRKSGHNPVYSIFILELAYCKPSLDIKHSSMITYKDNPQPSTKKKSTKKSKSTSSKPKVTKKKTPKTKKKTVKKKKPAILSVSDEE